MRTITLIMLLCIASVSYGQIVEQRTWASEDSGYVTTTWKKIRFASDEYYKIVRVDIDHDTTAYARRPVLYYAFNDDTVAGKIMPLRPGENIRHDGLGIMHVFVKASADSVPARLILSR